MKNLNNLKNKFFYNDNKKNCRIKFKLHNNKKIKKLSLNISKKINN